MMKAKKFTPAKVAAGLAAAVLALLLVFLLGRFGWKLGGFRACESAGINAIVVTEDSVRLTGFYPGSFPEGFCGYYAKEDNGKLYVGFRFSAVFGLFETGDFDITIPVRGEIHEVILKTSMSETSLWNSAEGSLSRSERCGVYVKLERNDVCSAALSYDGGREGVCCTEDVIMESGQFCFLDHEIMIASKEAGAPVPFTITIKDADGTVVASGEFSFDTRQEKMYLTVTADNKIVEDKSYEG